MESALIFILAKKFYRTPIYKFTALSEGSIVHHKKFGEGRVVKIINNEKFIHVKFTIGEKKFVYPDAFMMGFLEVK